MNPLILEVQHGFYYNTLLANYYHAIYFTLFNLDNN